MSLIHGFTVLRDEPLAEYGARAVLYRHQKTGAELLSLALPDENKVFGITFRTPPGNSTGVAHILEHSVLCGSRKYPVKEPFVELLKGSLQTFLNAFTYPDKTCYPVASTNLRDFYNLVDVYLDAVLFPLIPRHVFGQEGWHYEVDAEGRLTRSGVVLNEMKGAYSSPDSLLSEFSQRLLFPDTTYGVDSGGEPAVIPKLTFDAFLAFHRAYYHPGNARVFFSGDDDPTERLRLLDGYFSQFEARPPAPEVTMQAPFAAPRSSRLPYAAAASPGGEAPKAYLTVNWLLPDVMDPDRVLTLDVLEHVLIGLPSSPLRKALLDSGLGEDLAGGGLEAELRQMFFSTGLKGVTEADTGKVEALVMDTLAGLARDGVPADAVEAGVNALEFALRENNTGSFPRGLSLMLRALTTWLHGGDPLSPLRFEGPLARLKARLAAGEPVFEEALRAHYVQNPHRLTLTLAPDPDLEAARKAAEEGDLGQAKEALGEAGIEAAQRELAELRRFQETPDAPEDLAKIPRLAVADLPTEEKPIPAEASSRSGCTVIDHDLDTRGILYLDLAFPLSGVPDALLPLVPLFGRALLETGTDKEDSVSLTRRIARTTGGIYRDTLLSSVLAAPSSTAMAMLVLRGKAMVDKAHHLTDILADVIAGADFDNRERFSQMVLEAKARVERRLVPSGHAAALTRLRARYNAAAYAAERMRGLTQLFYLRELVRRMESDWPGVRADLEALRRLVLTRCGACVNLTVAGADRQSLDGLLTEFIDRLPDREAGLETWTPAPLPRAEAIVIPAQIHFVGLSLDLAKVGWSFDGADMVAARFLRMAYLWDRVRVRGGAYGAFCSLDRFAGLATFVSYRDPNTERTLAAFRSAGEYLATAEIADEELTRAVIGAVGDIDAHLLPDAKGHVSMVRRLVGDTPEVRAAMRRQVLTAGRARFRQLGEALTAAMADADMAVLGPRESMEALAATLPGLAVTEAF